MDMKLHCVDCGREFDFTVEEQRFFMRNGYSMPKRCKTCRGEKEVIMPTRPTPERKVEPQVQPAPAMQPVVEPTPVPVEPAWAEPVQPAWEQPAPVEPAYEPESVQPAYEPEPEVEPVKIPIEPEPVYAEPIVEYSYYIVVDGDRYVSIDTENKMVNVRKDKRDLFDDREQAEEWASFLAEHGVKAEIREVAKN